MVRLLEPAGPPLARNGADASDAGGHENGPSDPPRLRPKYTRCAARMPIPVEIGAASGAVVDWQFYIRYTQIGPRRTSGATWEWVRRPNGRRSITILLRWPVAARCCRAHPNWRDRKSVG